MTVQVQNPDSIKTVFDPIRQPGLSDVERRVFLAELPCRCDEIQENEPCETCITRLYLMSMKET